MVIKEILLINFYEILTESGVNKIDCDDIEINKGKCIVIIPFEKVKCVNNVKYLNFFYIKPVNKEEIHLLRMTIKIKRIN